MADAPSPAEVFARRVREVRTRKGWTQQDLADRMEELGWPIDRATIARTEGRDRNVSLEEALVLTAALGTQLTHMLVDPEGPAVALASGLVLSSREARQWLRGQASLEGEERMYYTEVPREEFEELVQRRASWERAMLTDLAQGIVDAVLEADVDKLTDEDRARIAGAVDALNEGLAQIEGRKAS